LRDLSPIKELDDAAEKRETLERSEGNFTLTGGAGQAASDLERARDAVFRLEIKAREEQAKHDKRFPHGPTIGSEQSQSAVSRIVQDLDAARIIPTAQGPDSWGIPKQSQT
jgi:hypothetical protein